jgi:hypothetical protein
MPPLAKWPSLGWRYVACRIVRGKCAHVHNCNVRRRDTAGSSLKDTASTSFVVFSVLVIPWNWLPSPQKALCVFATRYAHLIFVLPLRHRLQTSSPPLPRDRSSLIAPDSYRPSLHPNTKYAHMRPFITISLVAPRCTPISTDNLLLTTPLSGIR